MTTNRSSKTAHRDAATFAHLTPLYPDVPDHVWRIMLSYHPKAPAAAWHAVREFTIATALVTRPETYDETRRLMTMTARFHIWAWTTGTRELTVAELYTQHRIDRYLGTVLRSHSSAHRWGTSRQLVAVARAMSTASVRTITTPEFAGPQPFTDREIATMHSWSRSLSTVNQRNNAFVLLGLAGGAGLRPEEIVAARAEDLEVTGGRVFVRVTTGKARRVPVRHSWARVLLKGTEDRTTPGEMLFRGHRCPEYPPRVIQTFLTDHPAPVRPTVTRLRTTWILRHLNAGVPIPVLQEVAGFENRESLSYYIRHANAVDSAAFIGLLIGEELA